MKIANCTKQKRKGQRMKNNLNVGDRIHCKNWQDLRRTALQLSAEGYGVSVIGFADMAENVLTITALPEGSEGK